MLDTTHLLSLIRALGNAARDYTDLAPCTQTGHSTIVRMMRERALHTTLDQLLACYNAATPAHWPDLALCIVFAQNTPMLKPAFHDAPHLTDEALGVPVEEKRLARLFGVLTELVAMRAVPLNARCQQGWMAMGLPDATQPLHPLQPLRLMGYEGTYQVKATGLHDLVGQATVSFHHWPLTLLASGSRRASAQDSFQDGQTWLRKNFFKYLDTCWMCDAIKHTAIVSTGLLDKPTQKYLREKAYHIATDRVLHAVLAMLHTVDTTRPKTLYSVFVPAYSKHPIGSLFLAHDGAHAMAQAMIRNIDVVAQMPGPIHPLKGWHVYEAVTTPLPALCAPMTQDA